MIITEVRLPLSVEKNKVTGEFSDSTWIDTGTIDRLELANKTYKDEN